MATAPHRIVSSLIGGAWLRWCDMKRQRVNTDERGQMLILFVFGLAALMGIVALTIDVGLAYVNRREMMNAADAAVLAGAARLLEGASPPVAVAEAQEFAEKNGYFSGEGGISVSINVPPISGPHRGDGNYIEVVIEREVDTVFATVLGQSTWSITARAVAGVEAQSNAEYALIALNEDASSALRLNGNASITVNGAGGHGQLQSRPCHRPQRLRPTDSGRRRCRRRVAHHR